MTLRITDVSSAQGNYVVGSNGEQGVIIKATQGNYYVNPNCDFVAQQAISKNLPWGLYHYAGGADAVAEADYFYDNIKGYLNVSNKPLLILDWEEYQNSNYGNGAWTETFLKRLKERTGVQGGIYGNGGDLAQVTQWVADNAYVWFAGYPYAKGTTQMIQDWNYPDFPYQTGKLKTITAWQFSSQPLDKSVFYIDEKGWAKLAGATSTPNVKPVEPSKPVTPPKPQKVKVDTFYGMRLKNGAWLDEVTNVNTSGGFAGYPNKEHDLIYIRVNHGVLRYRAHTIESGWHAWVTKGDKNDTVNGCAGVPGQTLDAVQVYYETPNGEKYQQAYYRSQTTKRSGWLPVVRDDTDFAGMMGEPMDRFQVLVDDHNPF